MPQKCLETLQRGKILAKPLLWRSPTINHLFIVVSRLIMQTRDAVAINYWLKFYDVD